ncbi:MAG: phosphoribosyl-AMP cyclohydrolase [Alphaproteobacteria bacterium]|jgi:phosphoribosyl-AMP cyclohydrolase
MPQISPDTINAVLEQLKFNADGLVPAIAQDADSLEILMMAWQNKEAVRASLTEQAGIYFSRSRQQLWRKGESSGNMQQLIAYRFDCDKDCVVMLVKQTGAACHTNRRTCFFNEVQSDKISIIFEPL